MSVFLLLSITILILITVVIIQSRDKSTKKPTNPTTDPPVTTDPPACTKYKYDKECLDSCGDKYVNETEKTCYNGIPSGKYADGKTLLDNCGDKYVNETEKTCYNGIPQGKYADGKILLDNCIESINNKYTYDKTCVLNCDPYNYVEESKCYNDIPQDKYLASDGKTIVLSCNNNDYVDKTNRICYDDIPQGKYADGKILLDNCIESINNKYTYNETCVLNCDAYNYIDGNTCYNSIPPGKFLSSDGKTIVLSCNNNDYVDTMESKCYYDDIPQDKYLASDGKTIVLSCNNNDYVDKTKRICYNYFPSDIYYLDTDNKTLVTSCGNNYVDYTEKKCLTVNQLTSYREFDNVKINNDFSKFITNTSDAISPTIFFNGINQQALIASNATDFIDLKISNSGSFYAKVYKTKIEIFDQDLFNQPNANIKYRINILQNITGTDSTSEVEDFNFIGEESFVVGSSRYACQAVISLKSNIINGEIKKTMYLILLKYNYDYQITNLDVPKNGVYNINSEIFTIHKPVYLGTYLYVYDNRFASVFARRDMIGVCFSFKSQNESSLYYSQFILNYDPNSSNIYLSPTTTLIINDTQYANTYEYINVKPTINIVPALKFYNDNSSKLDIIKLTNYSSLSSAVLDTTMTKDNVVSNVAVGSNLSNYDAGSTIYTKSTDIIYYVTRDNSKLKLQKYKYISSNSTTDTMDVIAYEFPVSSSDAYAYLTSNRDGSILAIGIHDGNTKSLWKYTEATNTVSKIL